MFSVVCSSLEECPTHCRGSGTVCWVVNEWIDRTLTLEAQRIEQAAPVCGQVGVSVGGGEREVGRIGGAGNFQGQRGRELIPGRAPRP